MEEKPPPILGNARLLEYAVLDESVGYSGHSSIFVGVPGKGFEELGRVPCLAIVQDLKSGELMLLHCDQGWDLLATGGNYDSIAQAKARAERVYPGVSARWIDAGITDQEALRYRDAMWADQRCSFCDKSPPDVNQVIGRNDVRICDSCVAEFQQMMREES